MADKKTGLKVMQLWGVLLLAAAAVVGVSTAVGYRPEPGKSTVMTIVLAVAGVLAIVIAAYVRRRYTIQRRRR